MATALLVEDNAMNRKLFRDILEIRFDVIEAHTGGQALDSALTHQPDLVILDIELPDMSGLEVAKKLRQNPAFAATPIIGLSAHAMRGNAEEALAAGCTEYVTKPLMEDPIDFADRLAVLVGTEKSAEPLNLAESSTANTAPTASEAAPLARAMRDGSGSPR